jgi:uncharacterized protein
VALGLVDQIRLMSDPLVHQAAVYVVFLIAGLVKGITGLGLPTVAVGLLSLIMPPSQAAGLLIMPALMTNLWQMLSGPGLVTLARRLWLMQIGVIAGTWLGAGLITRSDGTGAAILLGALLSVYAVVGLKNIRLPLVPKWGELWLGPIVGTATGLVTAATGVFVVPAVPYLQALQLDRDRLMKALGLSFTVSTVALAWSLSASGSFTMRTGANSLIALIPTLIGMAVGQRLLRMMRPDIFRRWFFGGLLLLGLDLMIGKLL